MNKIHNLFYILKCQAKNIFVVYYPPFRNVFSTVIHISTLVHIPHVRKTYSILVWPNVHPCIALNPIARWRADDVPTTLCIAFSYPWILRNFIATAPCKSKSISESDRILLMKPVGAPFGEVFLNFNMGKPANRHSKFSSQF